MPESRTPRPKYVARTHYGTRGAERSQHLVHFGKYRATIYRRSDVPSGSWFIRIYLRGEGRHYRRSLRTTDKTTAKERAHDVLFDVLKQVDGGQRVLAISFRELVRRFHLHLEQQVASGVLAPRTLQVQRYRIGLGCAFLQEQLSAGVDAKVSSIDGEIFNRYLEWRLAKAAKDRKDGTIRRDVVRDELLVIRKMFHFGRREKLCPERAIPNWDFVIEKVGAQRRRITREDYKNFINCIRSWVGEAKNDRESYHRSMLRHFVLVVANSGMRSGELFGLRNQDVEQRASVNECVVTIRPETSKVRKGRRITVLASSGGRSDGSWEVNYLLRWISERQRHKEPADFVFSPYDTGKRSARDIYYHTYKQLRTKLKEIGLDWFDTYHCRHFWITNRLLAEEPIHHVAKTAGTSTSEIERTYSHVLTELASKRFGRKQVHYNQDGSWDVITREPRSRSKGRSVG